MEFAEFKPVAYSKDPEGPALTVPGTAWQAFLTTVT